MRLSDETSRFFDYITFDNGWSIRPSGTALLLCPPTGDCRAF